MVLIIKHFDLETDLWPGSGRVILLQGQVWAWEEREFQALEPTGDRFQPKDESFRGGGTGLGGAGCGEGSARRVKGRVQHLCTKRKGEPQKSGKENLFDLPLNSQVAAGHQRGGTVGTKSPGAKRKKAARRMLEATKVLSIGTFQKFPQRPQIGKR